MVSHGFKNHSHGSKQCTLPREFQRNNIETMKEKSSWFLKLSSGTTKKERQFGA